METPTAASQFERLAADSRLSDVSLSRGTEVVTINPNISLATSLIQAKEAIEALEQINEEPADDAPKMSLG